MKLKSLFKVIVFLSAQVSVFAAGGQKFSSAGYYQVPFSGRDVYNFNQGWRFLQGDAEEAQSGGFDDSSWELVSLPHTVGLVSAEASGCRNYQGPAWYRKRFTLDETFDGKHIFLHFEAIMGRCEIFVDGKPVSVHTGGYLPVIIDLRACGVKAGKESVIAVFTDNSDDGSYPPGKPEDVLDFTYHGGIYRDCWLVAHSDIYVTDPNFVDKQAGGGIFVHSEEVSESKATLFVETDIQNDGKSTKVISLSSELEFAGLPAKTAVTRVSIPAGKSRKVTQKINVDNPQLWTPQTPHLYSVITRLTVDGKVVDGMETRVGIRSIDFRGEEGFYLNGKPYEGKLVGVNRHQDYAYIGNAMPNNLTWRDAVLLRNAGCTIIRSAHYPQDPSFMDACDALGMFVIVATPGWQYWNENPSFADHVYDDIRQMVRRDRNHPSVIMWEPILNETHYPADFARRAYEITHAEYPYHGCFCAADEGSDGVRDLYDIMYGSSTKTGKCTFIREWGDYVDNWEHHNSMSRASRSWGEGPMLIQAIHYANHHDAIDYDRIHSLPPQLVGGCLWHSFDHQRGYHPDPFWGGIMDAFRQPKYSYYMFKAQQPASFKSTSSAVESGPMVYVANEFSPFSDEDVTVFTNCDAVRLIMFGTDTLYQEVNRKDYAMPSAPVIFKDAYSFHKLRQINPDGKASVVAEGIIDGKVAARQITKPSARSYHIKLELDDAGMPFEANGSDIVTVIASIVDEQGKLRALAKEFVVFEIEGEAEIIGNEDIQANPRAVEFGTAPLLVRATSKPGKITVRARVQFGGELAPTPAEISFESKPSGDRFVHSEVRTELVRGPQLPYIRETGKQSAENHAAEREKVFEDQKLFGER